jgi:hypothetical protein
LPLLRGDQSVEQGDGVARLAVLDHDGGAIDLRLIGIGRGGRRRDGIRLGRREQ